MTTDETRPESAPPQLIPGAGVRPPTLGDRLAASARLGEIGRPSPAGVFFMRFVVAPYVRLCYRPKAIDWEKLPDRPCLLVANHSGGGVVDVIVCATLWFRKFGTARRITGLAHPAAFHVPFAAWVLRSIGAVPSTYEHALLAFERGASVLVFPGGDHESYRPIWQANRVDWNQREGFIRIARRAWVPIVPVGINGSHYTAPMLWRSRALPWLLVLPRALGIKRVPISLFFLETTALWLWLMPPRIGWPWSLVIAYLWFCTPFSWSVPTIPWTVRVRVGDPLEPTDLFAASQADVPPVNVAERVRGAVQAIVSGPRE